MVLTQLGLMETMPLQYSRLQKKLGDEPSKVTRRYSSKQCHIGKLNSYKYNYKSNTRQTLALGITQLQMTASPTGQSRRWRIGKKLVGPLDVIRVLNFIHSTLDNPHHRLRKYLESKDWWTAEDEETARQNQKKAVMTAFYAAEKVDKPSLDNMFNDVYDELPWNLVSFDIFGMNLSLIYEILFLF